MSNDDTGSERALGRLAGQLLAGMRRPRVLVGGLGMGFTLRALLDGLPAHAIVVVAELLPAVARWNEHHLGHLSGHPLQDARVRLRISDVVDMLPGRPMWDAILLDVDNGPDWLVQRRNHVLYGRRGLARLVASLRDGGFLAIWSAARHSSFERRVMSTGLRLRRVGWPPGPDAAQMLYLVSTSASRRQSRSV